MAICDNMVRLRKQKRWSQSKLAELTGLSRGYIASIEEGRQYPSVKVQAIIAESLGVGLEELIRDSGG